MLDFALVLAPRMAYDSSPLLGSKPAPDMLPAPFDTHPPLQSSRPDDRLPVAIAHRGYKAAYPENTLRAFSAAVDIGAHAIETDIHLSKDKVVVLSHDATLKRCFGEDKKLADCDWSYLSTLETLAEPKQHMPRLVDLLAYLARPENEHTWVLLDIKRDDDADELLGATAAAIASVKLSVPWSSRVVLGAWSERYIDLCRKHLPGFAVAFINWSLPEAFKLLRESDVWFNLLQPSLVGPCGSRFIRKARREGRPLFVWTVNRERWMHWSIRKRVNGVITDDPKKFLEVCEQWKAGRGQRSTTPGQFLREVFVQFVMAVFAPMIWLLVRGSNRRRVLPIKV